MLAGGGLAVYLGAAAGHQEPTARPRPTARSVRVVSALTVGLIAFGPDDDGDPWTNDPEDHPLMLRPSRPYPVFAQIPRPELTAGTPQWTADKMADGSVIFIDIATGQCLTASASGTRVVLAHCDLSPLQHWRARGQRTVFGQSVAQYQNIGSGGCVTAPRIAGQALLSRCGRAGTRSQEIAFWWGA